MFLKLVFPSIILSTKYWLIYCLTPNEQYFSYIYDKIKSNTIKIPEWKEERIGKMGQRLPMKKHGELRRGDNFSFLKRVKCIYPLSKYKKFEDTKGAIRNRISKTNRQHNGQRNKYKKTNNDLQNIHIKLKIE